MLAKRIAGCLYLSTTVSQLFDGKARMSAEIGPIFGFWARPWERRSRDRHFGCMGGKEIQCFQNTSQDVGIYLQPFPSY